MVRPAVVKDADPCREGRWLRAGRLGLGSLPRGGESPKARPVLMCQGGEEDSDAEEDDQTLLQSIESRLLQHDPTFTENDTMVGRVHLKNALMNAFVLGGTTAWHNSEDVQASHQLHLNVERIRVPETWFQPSMFGVDSAGLGELAGWVMNGYEEDVRRRMMQVSLGFIRCCHLCGRNVCHGCFLGVRDIASFLLTPDRDQIWLQIRLQY